MIWNGLSKVQTYGKMSQKTEIVTWLVKFSNIYWNAASRRACADYAVENSRRGPKHREIPEVSQCKKTWSERQMTSGFGRLGHSKSWDCLFPSDIRSLGAWPRDPVFYAEVLFFNCVVIALYHFWLSSLSFSSTFVSFIFVLSLYFFRYTHTHIYSVMTIKYHFVFFFSNAVFLDRHCFTAFCF